MQVLRRALSVLLFCGSLFANSQQQQDQEHKIKGYDGQDSNYYNAHETTQQHFSHGTTGHGGGDFGKGKTEEDDIFYFFSLHDYNKDHHLDGHELALAFQGYEFYNATELENTISQSDLEYMIDNALLEDDLDNDGKISWAEYLASQQYHHKLPDE